MGYPHGEPHKEKTWFSATMLTWYYGMGVSWSTRVTTDGNSRMETSAQQLLAKTDSTNQI